MRKPPSIAEFLAATATIIVCGNVGTIASGYGALGISEIYRESEQLDFMPVTLLAITAYRWLPYVYPGLMAVHLWNQFRPGYRAWVTWCLLCVNALVIVLVFYGIARLFATTMFKMGNS